MTLSREFTRCADATCAQRHTCARFQQVERDKQAGGEFSYVATLRGHGICWFRIAEVAK